MIGRRYDTTYFVEFLYDWSEPETKAEQAITNVIK